MSPSPPATCACSRRSPTRPCSGPRSKSPRARTPPGPSRSKSPDKRVSDSKIGEKRIDRKNDLATFTFVGLNLAPGPNRIRVTAVGPDGSQGKSVEVTAYGRGPAKRLEIVSDKPELSAGGRDSTDCFACEPRPVEPPRGGRLGRARGLEGKSRKELRKCGRRRRTRSLKSALWTAGGVDVPESPEEKNAPKASRLSPLVGGEGRVMTRLRQRAAARRRFARRRARSRAAAPCASPPKSAARFSSASAKSPSAAARPNSLTTESDGERPQPPRLLLPRPVPRREEPPDALLRLAASDQSHGGPRPPLPA